MLAAWRASIFLKLKVRGHKCFPLQMRGISNIGVLEEECYTRVDGRSTNDHWLRMNTRRVCMAGKKVVCGWGGVERG
jgi:hypothetical protein